MKFRTESRQNSQAPSTKAEQINYQELARVAYELYERRGREHGHDMEDWLKAEAIVRQRTSRSFS